MTPELLQLVFNIIATIYMVFIGVMATTQTFTAAIAFRLIPMCAALTGIALIVFQ